MSKSDNKRNSPYTVSTRKEAAIPLLYCNPQARLGLREKVREPIQEENCSTGSRPAMCSGIRGSMGTTYKQVMLAGDMRLRR